MMKLLKNCKDFLVAFIATLHEAKEMQRKSRRIP
jgi:hypothetical protein